MNRRLLPCPWRPGTKSPANWKSCVKEEGVVGGRYVEQGHEMNDLEGGMKIQKC